MSENYLTVSEVGSYLKSMINAEEMLHNIRIYGEISAFKISGAHAYFVVKDSEAQITCTCFNVSRTYIPKDGESLILSGSFDFYVKGGRLSFNVSKIEPVGKGLLYLKLLELKEKLSKEGLFDEKSKVPVPLYPQKVCVITSKTGAVIRDIITTVRKNNTYTDINLIDVRVQGEGAVTEIINALKLADTLNFDAIIVARGGGSFEDLAPFNDEKLARCIFGIETPVISAVGHETDFTICDWVSDLRVPTPTAAGERIGFDVESLKNYILNSVKNMSHRIDRKYSDAFSKLKLYTKSVTGKMEILMENKLSKIKSASMSLSDAASRSILVKQHIFEKTMTALEKSNPITILKNGYYKIEKDGISVKIKNLKPGDNIKAEGFGGSFEATVTKVRRGEE